MKPGRGEPVGLRAWILTRGVVRGLFLHHAFDHAATMGFYFFLGIIPLLVFAASLVGSVVQREGADAILRPLFRTMPKVASDLFRHEFHRLPDGYAPTLAPLSALGFLWLTTNGVHNLMDVFEMLVQARPRPWWRQRLVSIVWVVVGVAGLVAMTWLVLLIDGAAIEPPSHQLPPLLREAGGLLIRGWHHAGALVVCIAVAAGALATFYRSSVIHPRGVRRRVWAGTIVALVLWGLVSWGFGTYVKAIADYAVYYGSLAAVAVILLWLYLTSLSLLVGAEVNAHLEGMRVPSGEAMVRE